MSNKELNDSHIKYEENPWENDPMEQLTRVEDFLSSPEEIKQAVIDRDWKVTFGIDGDTAEYFMELAKKKNIFPEQVINQVLQEYIAQHPQY